MDYHSGSAVPGSYDLPGQALMKYKVERTDGTPIPADEPCFVFRAKDIFTPEVVKYYFDLCQRNGAPKEFLDFIDAHLVLIQEYQWAHPELVKYPD